MRGSGPLGWLVFGAWCLSAGRAQAADWLSLNGTELGSTTEAPRLFGFIQPQLEAIVAGGPVDGLEGELKGFDGTTPTFNVVAGEAPWSFKVQRARLGVRGVVPKTEGRVNYLLLLEGGQVALTRTEPVVVTDMAVTLSYLPGLRLRLGQFKLPVMEEIVQAVPASHEFIQFSQTLTRLLLENPVADGQYTGGADGFRDIGVMVFDGFQRDRWAGSYGLMLSNGNGLLKVDDDPAKDLSVRGELAWVFSGERTDLDREEIKLGGWWLEGQRSWEDGTERRARQGGFLHLERRTVFALVEAAGGQGMMELGANPPFPGSAVVIDPKARGLGVVLGTGARFWTRETAHWDLKVRLETYRHRAEDPAGDRVFRTATFGTEWSPAPPVRLQLNYELRDLQAPEGTPDASTLAASLGDRLSAQVTARF